MEGTKVKRLGNSDQEGESAKEESATAIGHYPSFLKQFNTFLKQFNRMNSMLHPPP